MIPEPTSPTCPFQIYGKVHQALPINQDGSLEENRREDVVRCPICNEIHENLEVIPAIQVLPQNKNYAKCFYIGLFVFISTILLVSLFLMFV